MNDSIIYTVSQNISTISENTEIPLETAKLIIPEGVKIIEDWALSEKSFEEVILPKLFMK